MAAGVDPERLVKIPPPLTPVPPPGPEREAKLRESLELGDDPVVVFAGDAEAGGGLRTLVESIPHILGETSARVVVTCRDKSAASREVLKEVEGLIASWGFQDECRLVGPVDDILATILKETPEDDG